MAATNKRIVQQYYHELWNRWEYALIPVLLAPDVAFRGSLGIDVTGHDGFGAYMDTVRAAFPDFHNTIEDVIAEGERVAVRLTYRGTHRGELFGFTATGRRIAYAGAAIFTMGHGRIAAGWVLGDVAGLVGQLRDA